MKNIYVIPSWYPNKERPHFGSQIRDQTDLFNEHSVNYNAIIGLRSDRTIKISYKNPKRIISQFTKGLFYKNIVSKQNRDTFEVGNPAFSYGNFPFLFHATQRDYILHKKNIEFIRRRWGEVSLIHAHVATPAGITAMKLSESLDIPYIVTERRLASIEKICKIKNKVFFDLREVFEKSASIICVSERQRSVIEKYFGFDDKVIIIPNFTDAKNINYIPNEYRNDKKCFNFVTLCGMDKYKGVEFLLRAVKQWAPGPENVNFLMGGDGKDLNNFKNLASELGVESYFEWKGTISRQNVGSFLTQGDVFVLPSLSESFGIVFIEALACGIPLIGTKCGGPEEIISSSTGILVEPGNSLELAKGLKFMYENKETYSSNRIREEFKNKFSSEHVVPIIERVYDKYSK